MSNERWQRAKAVFQSALEQPAEGRTTFVIAACGEDLELRGEVRSLLASHAEAAGFLSRPAVEQAEASACGRRIGPYRVLDEIARGGMGAVYRAVRDDDAFRKTVAIKLMHGGPGSEFMSRRFQQERQILAGLQHPNIATILDGGTTEDGQPYLVMEHVEGRPVTAFCAERGLTLRQRLELFRSICGAVQFAHQNLVVHRDIKPPNILVTADGMPKLLDFGIAKLMAAGIDPEYAPTVTMLPAMTPEYASPEQIKGEAVTTTADVYSLGVVLYELLAGVRPYEVKAHCLEEIVRAVCETEPQLPSAALRTHSADPSRLAATTQPSELRGDLDTIVMKALHKDPARRYGSAQELSEDLRRYLVGLPVLARPDTLRYRVGKFVARHKPGVAGVALVALLIVGFSVNTWLQSVRIGKERDKAERVSAFLVRLFDFADPGSSGARDVSARQILDKGVERIRSELKDEPEVRANLLDTMGTVYKSLALYDSAEPLLREALELRRPLLGRHPDVVRTLMNLAVLLWRKGDYGEAEALLREALSLHRTLTKTDDLSTAAILTNLAGVVGDRGDATQAEMLYREALAIDRRLIPGNDPALAKSLLNFASTLSGRGAYAEAEPLYHDGLEMMKAALGPEHPNVARAMSHMAEFLEEKGDYAGSESLFREALPMLRKAFGEEHRWVAAAMGNLADVLDTRGDYPAAEALGRQALVTQRKLLGSGHLSLMHTLRVLASVFVHEGELRQAEPLIREAIASGRTKLGEEHSDLASSQCVLGELLRAQGKLGEAEAAYHSALRALRKQLGDKHRSVADALSALGALLLDKGDPVAAEPLLREALNIRRAALPPGHPDTAETEGLIGACLAARGHFDEAEPMLKGSIILIEAKITSRSRASREARQRLVKLYEARGKPDEARKYRVRSAGA